MTTSRTHSRNTVKRQQRVIPAGLCLAGIIALTFPGTYVQAQDFGKLFTTQEERDYLDYLREENLRLSQENNFNIQQAVIPDIPVAEEDEADPGPSVTKYQFGGIMVRRNGSRMVWLNGAQVAESELPGNMALVQADGTTVLSIRAEGYTFRLKPGQTADVVNNRVLEPFQESGPPARPAAAAVLPATQAPAVEQPVPDDSPQETTATVAVNSDEPDPSDLQAILGRLETGDGDLSEEQIQEALEILTEQAEDSAE